MLDAGEEGEFAGGGEEAGFDGVGGELAELVEGEAEVRVVLMRIREQNEKPTVPIETVPIHPEIAVDVNDDYDDILIQNDNPTQFVGVGFTDCSDYSDYTETESGSGSEEEIIITS